MKTYKIYSPDDRYSTIVNGESIAFENDGKNIVIRDATGIVAIFPTFVIVKVVPNETDTK